MKSLPISLVVITKNEEKNIERCLKSASFVQDIVVLDSGSTDRTVEIARSLGARVFVEEWRGYFRQKVRATELAQQDWVLSLDADEALSAELADEIHKSFSDLRFDGYQCPRLSYHFQKWIRHGGWYPDWQLRFFDRRKCQWTGEHIHERVVGKSVSSMKHPILHWVFDDLADQVNTNNNYSTLGARRLRSDGRKFSLIYLMLKPISKFLETYIWKRGFLDGLPGLIISVGAAYSVFLKFSKLYEIELQENPSEVHRDVYSLEKS